MNRKTKTIDLFLRAALSAAAGAFVFLSLAVSARGAADALSLRVTPRDSVGPAPVADLAAAATVSEGQALLTWTEAPDLPSGNVQSFAVRVATFSAASLAGDTTAWWNAAAPLLIGVPSPLGAGSLQTMLVSNLPGGATYYFAIKSADASANVSPIDLNAGGSQAFARPRALKPAPVAGHLVFVNPDTSFTANWSPVTQNEDGSPASDIAAYVVRGSNNLNGPFTALVSSGTATSNPGFSASSAPAAERYMQVVAVDASGNESDPAYSNLLHVTPQGIIGQVGVAGDGSATRAYVPSSLMGELRTPAQDLLLRVRAEADPNLNRDPARTLATYTIDMVSPAQAVDKNFTFSRAAMNVILQYSPPSAGAAPAVGVLWWNGTGWLKVGAAEVDPVLRTASFKTSLPGTYQVRAFLAATELTLEKTNVFPRIFTPNGDGINDEVLFVIENPRLSAVDGKIYDVGGNEVADIKLKGLPTPDTMSWNGRDRNGSLVPAGVYIYRVKGEGKALTGTLVVAK